MNSKKGQVYLAAAIIVVGIIFGFLTVRGYVKKDTGETVVYDLQKELNYETGEVIDYAIYNAKDTHQYFENWTTRYAEAMGEKGIENWVFAYGNSENLTIITISGGTAGTITLWAGSSPISLNVASTVYSKGNFKDVGNIVNVKAGDFTYPFNLEKGQNFIFLIKKGGYIAEKD